MSRPSEAPLGRNRWHRASSSLQEQGDSKGSDNLPLSQFDKGQAETGVADVFTGPTASGAAPQGDVSLDPAAEEERSVLEAIYGAEFQVLGPSEWRIDLPGPPGAPPAALRLLLPAGYPKSDQPPVPIVECEVDAVQLRASEAIFALMSEWQPSDDTALQGCSYQWIERIRESLEPVLEEAAVLAAAETAEQVEMDAVTAADFAALEVALAAEGGEARGFQFLPSNPQYGQRSRRFNAESFDPANMVEIKIGEPFTDRKSTFQAFAAQVANAGQVSWALRCLLEQKKIAAATHNIFAYRFKDESKGVQVADNDDDGEDGAGSKLAELLSLAGCENVFVMVSRWYGGVMLGPDRFKHICRCASVLLDTSGWSKRGKSTATAPKSKR